MCIIGDVVNTTTMHNMSLLQASSPPHDSYMQTPITPSYLPTSDDQSAEIALVGSVSSKVVSESERIEYTPVSPVDEIQVVQEATDTGGSSEILLPPSALPSVKPASTSYVTGEIYVYIYTNNCTLYILTFSLSCGFI